jgi:hypothetical protein
MQRIELRRQDLHMKNTLKGEMTQKPVYCQWASETVDLIPVPDET